mgnify:CR=1 FL=1
MFSLYRCQIAELTATNTASTKVPNQAGLEGCLAPRSPVLESVDSLARPIMNVAGINFAVRQRVAVPPAHSV